MDANADGLIKKAVRMGSRADAKKIRLHPFPFSEGEGGRSGGRMRPALIFFVSFFYQEKKKAETSQAQQGFADKINCSKKH